CCTGSYPRSLHAALPILGAAVIGALLCIIPGFLFHLTFLARYPEILTEEVPLYTNIAATGMSVLMVAYLIVLIGTFIETGAGLRSEEHTSELQSRENLVC